MRIKRRSLLSGGVCSLLPGRVCSGPAGSPNFRPVNSVINLGGVPYHPSTADTSHIMIGENGVLRFQAKKGVRASWDVMYGSAVDRVELVADRASRVTYGQAFRWSFRLYVPRETRIEGDWFLLAQLHQTGDHPHITRGVNPPFSVCWNTEGLRGLSVLSRSSSVAHLPKNGYVKPFLVFNDPAFPRDAWVRLQFDLLFDWSGDAAASVRIDGTEVARFAGPDFSLGYEWDAGATGGVYPQFGIYRASAIPGNPWRHADPTDAEVYFSDVQVGRVVRIVDPADPPQGPRIR